MTAKTKFPLIEYLTGLRKFLVVVLGECLGFWLCLQGQMEGSGFVTITLGLAGLYITGNVTAAIQKARG